jgi:beta-xylosidase
VNTGPCGGAAARARVGGVKIFRRLAALFGGLGLVVRAANPFLDGADPHAVRLGGRYWVYPTTARTRAFEAFSSADLQTWRQEGTVLRLADVAWAAAGGRTEIYAWAPALVVRGGEYFFYYSVGPQRPGQPARIGVATGTSPAGPFRDSGRPLLTGDAAFEAIDPMVFHDDRSGKHYLYAGGSAGATLRQFELGPDLISLARELPVETPPQFTEGAFVHRHGDRYYLSYSHGSWRHDSYSVHYATGDSPVGPWTYAGPILVSDARHKGPGHHSLVPQPAGPGYLIFYHRWNRREGPGPYSGGRALAVDTLVHGPDGRIEPVRMTGD